MQVRRKSFFQSAFFAFFLSLASGIGSYWLLNRWLTPHPVVNLFLEIQRGEMGKSIQGFACDADGRWLVVVKKARDENKKKHPVLVYDLLSDRKLDWESDWEDEGIISSSPIIDGLRCIQKTPDGRLHVLEWNFPSKTKRVTTLDIMPSPNQSNVVLKNHGKYLVVLNRWQLWPWWLLAPGQWPLEALFLQNHPARLPNTSDYGVEVAIWDMETKKLYARIFLAPPVPYWILNSQDNSGCISIDGHWLVVPEAIKRVDSVFWAKADEHPEGVKAFVPAEPRGVRVVDLATGQTKRLEPSNVEEARRTQAGAYLFSLDEGFVRLENVAATPHPSQGVEYLPTTGFNEYYQTFDLITGKRATHVFPDYHKLAEPGWGATHRHGPDEWPDWLQSLTSKLGIDLNQYPLPEYLTVTFLDTRTGNPRFVYKLKRPDHETQATILPSGRAVMINRLNDEGAEFIRWQIPFEVYSPWWSLGAGLFFFMLPLAWWVWRYTTSPRIAG